MFLNLYEKIGACLKDCSLTFWEKNDDFVFSKQFSILQYTEDYSTEIWYLEQSRKWITTNVKNNIYSWNLLDECLEDTI